MLLHNPRFIRVKLVIVEGKVIIIKQIKLLSATKAIDKTSLTTKRKLSFPELFTLPDYTVKSASVSTQKTV